MKLGEREEKKKLSLLLEHWVEHNKEHEQDFMKWAERAKTFDGLVYEELMEAVKHMEEVNDALLNALEHINK